MFFSSKFVEILLKLGYIHEKQFKYLVKQRVKCLSSSGGHSNCNLPGGVLGPNPGGGTRSENWWGCAAGCWNLDPKRSREKWNLGPKRSNSVRIGSFNTPKDHLGVGGWDKIPHKDRVQSSECQKRGSKRRHIHITQHRGSTLPGTRILGGILVA